MKKNNSGITLVSLIITIIVLLILASITVYSGASTIRSAKLTKFTTELKMMQQKVNELYDSYTKNKSVTVKETEYVGTDIQNIGQNPDGIFNTNRLNEIFSESGSGITDKTGYMYYDTETIQALELEDMEYEFFVNVAKRSVVSIEGFNDYGKRYYTLDQVPDGVYNVEYNKVDGNLSYETTSEVKNGQGKIHIINISYDEYVNKWQVRYRLKVKEGEEEKSWTTTEEFTGNEFTIDVPIENLLKDYEIQIIHGDEIASEIKMAHVLQIGDYINYDPTNGGTITTTYTSPQGTYHADESAAKADMSENMKEGNGYADQTFSVEANTNGWRVLGVDEDTNQILLISADVVKTTDNNDFYLRGQTGYEWGIKELNDICAIYGKGSGASGARSINVDDINKITGYNPETAQCYDGEIYEYGNKVTYIKNEGSIEYSASYGQSGVEKDEMKIFKYFDENKNIWKLLNTGENKKYISTAYFYFPNTLTTNPDGDTNGISTESVEYDLLGFKTGEYWLGSSIIRVHTNYVGFGINYVNNSGVGFYGLSGSDGYIRTGIYGVRPVVSLKSNINLSGGAGTSEEPYQIQ